MALPVISNARRYIKYGRTEKMVRAHLDPVSLFGVRNVWLHESVVERFKAWERSVREYENATIYVGGKPRKRVTHPFKADRIDSFNWRLIKKRRGGYSKNRSMHSWGIAIDMNPNPANTFGPCHPPVPEYVYLIARKRGLTCGHYWKKPDHPHIEWRR